MSNEETNEVVQTSPNELKNLDLSNLILIKNADDEILIGYNVDGKHNTIISNSAESEKLLVHHNYGTLIHNMQNPAPLIIDPQRVYAIRFEIMLIKYIILLLSFILIVIDIKNVKLRIDSRKEIITELRAVHIQMDDVQLYQVFWSFVIVYIIAIFGYTLTLILALYSRKIDGVKYVFRFSMFTIIYQFIELILKRYISYRNRFDILLFFLRLVIIMFLRRWIILDNMLDQLFLLEN